MFAPVKTPATVVSKLNSEIHRYLRSQPAKDIFLRAGIDPSPSTPEELVESMNVEVARLGKVMKAAVGK